MKTLFKTRQRYDNLVTKVKFFLNYFTFGLIFFWSFFLMY
jgi:hypothetical protein